MRSLRSFSLLSVPLATALILAAACTTQEETGSDDDGGGAGGSTSQGTNPGEVYQTSPALAAAELERLTGYLASDELTGRDEGTAGGQLARTFIIEEMKRCGIQPAVGESYEQPITTGAGVNILGIVPGSDPALADRTVVVSAHYDHLGDCGGAICNGADDNAAGVAIVLGVGCAIAENPAPRSVLIASWDAEEPPTFMTAAMGSRFYAENPVVPLEQTDAVIVLDLVGSDLWPGFGGHFLLGGELSPQVASAVDEATKPEGLAAYRAGLHLAEEQPLGQGRQPWSDYDAFRNLSKPVLFLSNGQNKRYHTPADEMATINMPKVELEARYLANVVGNLAHAAETPVFDPAGADYALDAANMQLVLEAALAPGGLIDSLGLSANTRANLEGDLAAAAEIGNKLASGEAATEQDIRRLRDGTQRIMCVAGSTYAETICNAF